MHRSIKFAYTVIVLFATGTAFLVMQIRDEASVTGMAAVVRINDSEGAIGGARVTAMLESFARERGVNVGREIGDLQHPESVRHLYLAVGDPDAVSAAWLKDGYPWFSRAVDTEVHPIAGVSGRDPRGYYYLYGPPEHAPALLVAFNDLGMQGWQMPFSPMRHGLEMLAQGTLLGCVAITALMLIVVVGSGVVTNTRAYGVRRLHGHSFGKVLAGDLADVATHVLRVAAVGVPVVALGLQFYNGLHQGTSFALVALGIFAAYAALAVFVHVLALGLVHHSRVLGALKGEIPAGWTMAGSYAIRVPALFLAVTAAGAVLLGGSQVREQRADLDSWSRAGDAGYLMLNGSLGRQTGELEQYVGEWIRRSAARGEVIVSWPERRGASALYPADGPDRDVLVVNGTYLREQPVVDTNGRAVTGPVAVADTVQVLVPSRYWADRDAVVAGVGEWVTFAIGDRQVPLPRIEAVQTRDQQEMFTYNVSSVRQQAPRLTDPIMVVIPDGSTILSNVDYLAYATQNGIIFRDSRYVQAALSDPDLATYVLAVNPVTENAATQYRTDVRELRLRTVNLFATLAVLMITAASVAIIYCRKNAQQLFVKYICGWSFAKAYRPILLFEAVICAALIGWALFDVWSAPDRTDVLAGTRSAPSAPALGAWEPVMAGTIAIFSGALALIALARFNRAMVRERSAQV